MKRYLDFRLLLIYSAGILSCLLGDRDPDFSAELVTWLTEGMLR